MSYDLLRFSLCSLICIFLFFIRREKQVGWCRRRGVGDRGDGEYEGYWLLLIIYIDRKTGRKTKELKSWMSNTSFSMKNDLIEWIEWKTKYQFILIIYESISIVKDDILLLFLYYSIWFTIEKKRRIIW